MGNNTIKSLLGYMTISYSLSGLLMVLGLTGNYSMAAEVAIVQGAVLATFYVLSGDARHMILSERMQARHVVYFRLLTVLPLAVISYLLTISVTDVSAALAAALILRRATEWLAEPHVTELERQHQPWGGLLLQFVLFPLVIFEILYFGSLWLIWPWAVSPLLHSLKFLLGAERYNILSMGKAHTASTAVMGISNYILRVLVVDLAGKTFAGMVFPAVAIGSFAGTMFANIVGPSLLRKGLNVLLYLKVPLMMWTLIGVGIFIFSQTVFQQALGLSIIGGVIMLFAQQSRLHLLREDHTLGADTMVHLVLVCLVPIMYSITGQQWLTSIYLLNAALAWGFYVLSDKLSGLNQLQRHRLLILTSVLLVLPIFFQIQGDIYLSESPEGLLDSGGFLQLVPLPFSLLACYLGLVFFNEGITNSKPAIVTLSLLFFLLSVSALVTGSSPAKLIQLVQVILPVAALLLGASLAWLNRNLVARTMLNFLLVFIPLHLLATWFQGKLELTHNLYLFSIYQHELFVPLVMVSIFAWVVLELFESHKKQLLFLAPLVAVYVVAGNSRMALIGLSVFAAIFMVIGVRSKQRYMLGMLVMIAVSSLSYNFLQNTTRQQTETIAIEESYEAPVDRVEKQSRVSIQGDIQKEGGVFHQWLDALENPSIIIFGHAWPMGRHELDRSTNYYSDLVYNFGLIVVFPIVFLLIYTVFRFVASKEKSPVLIGLFLIVLYHIVVVGFTKLALKQPYPGIITFFLWGVLLTMLKSDVKTDLKSDFKSEQGKQLES